MDILFFLGSGVSYKSGLPATNTITNSILNGDWHLHSDQNFYSGLHNNPYFDKHDITPQLQKLLKYIKVYSDNFYKGRYKSKPNLEATYEDVFFIVKQVHDHLDGEIDNPAIKLFVEHLQDEFKFGSNPEFSHYDEPLPIDRIFWYAEDFISCAVWQLLSTQNEPVGFNLLLDLIKSKEFNTVNIGTSNHDLLVEKFLEMNNIQFTDGFSQPDGDFCYFNPDLYNNNTDKVNLYKLHGSLNWYRLRDYDKEAKITSDFYSKINKNHMRCQNSKGEMLGPPLNSYPIFLTGTNNKLESYNFGIVRYMHLKFDEVLRKHNRIIMSGYGWNDRGINVRLFEWVSSSMDHKIILLHENPDLIESSKSAMWYRYKELLEEKRLIPIKKWMSDTNINDVLPFIK